ncbi:unnamed protein product, partial [Symbiodinium sp. CCMP2456]
ENGWPPSAGDEAESQEKFIDDLQDRKTEIYRGYVTPEAYHSFSLTPKPE